MKKVFLLLNFLVLQEALALPHPSAPLNEITKKVNLEGIGEIMGDSDDPSIIYVFPVQKKYTGTFVKFTTGVDCQKINDLRDATYKMPKADEFMDVLAGNTFYSPLFEYSIGVRSRNHEALESIRKMEAEASKLLTEQQDLYGRYTSLQEQLNELKLHKSALVDERRQLDSWYQLEIVRAENDEAKSLITQQYKDGYKELSAEISEVDSEINLASRRYWEVLGQWAPYRDQLKWLNESKSSLIATYLLLQQNAKETFETSKALLVEMEQKVIGTARVGYTLSAHDQVSELSHRIKSANLSGKYTVKSIPMFDVQLNSTVMNNNVSIQDSQYQSNFEFRTYSIPRAAAVKLPTVKKFERFNGVEFKSDNDDSGELEILMSQLDDNSGHSMVFETPITQGAFCGNSQEVEKTYAFTDSEGKEIIQEVAHPVYVKKFNPKIFNQHVALRFKYFAKAEPLKGRCELNISDSASYFRSVGSKKSGGFFSRKKKSWDNTKSEVKKDMGLECVLTLKPQHQNPEQAQLMAEAFEKALYQDMFSMFLMSFAKEYTIDPIKPELLGVESKFFNNVGSGVMNLCGKNKFCEFGGIVLKSLDELVGIRQSGKTSSIQKYSGTISKDFNKSSFMVNESAVDLVLNVCLNPGDCN